MRQIASLSTEIQDNAHFIKIIHARDKDSNQRHILHQTTQFKYLVRTLVITLSDSTWYYQINEEHLLYSTTLSNVYMYFQVYK